MTGPSLLVTRHCSLMTGLSLLVTRHSSSEVVEHGELSVRDSLDGGPVGLGVVVEVLGVALEPHLEEEGQEEGGQEEEGQEEEGQEEEELLRMFWQMRLMKLMRLMRVSVIFILRMIIRHLVVHSKERPEFAVGGGGSGGGGSGGGWSGAGWSGG